jgi:hypothetical protein
MSDRLVIDKHPNGRTINGNDVGLRRDGPTEVDEGSPRRRSALVGISMVPKGSALAALFTVMVRVPMSATVLALSVTSACKL